MSKTPKTQSMQSKSQDTCSEILKDMLLFLQRQALYAEASPSLEAGTGPEAGAEPKGHKRPLRQPLYSLSDFWLELERDLRPFSHVRHYRSGENVFLEGQEFGHCYYVYRGMVQLSHYNEQGQEAALNFIVPPGLFAEGLLFHKQREYPVTALTLEAATCLAIEQEALRRFIPRYKDLHLALSRSMAQKLDYLNTRMRHLMTEGLEQRLLEYLYTEQLRQKSHRITLPVQKQHLAMYLATSPETLSRLLAKLQKQDLISMQGKQILLEQGFFALFRE